MSWPRLQPVLPRARPDRSANLLGYDVERILRRSGGRPTLGSAAASVESVRLDPGLKRDLLLRAAKEKTSVSEIIRRAMGAYLQAG